MNDEAQDRTMRPETSDRANRCSQGSVRTTGRDVFQHLSPPFLRRVWQAHPVSPSPRIMIA
jgi:hypothetical protein